jgi:LPS export ABC transporter protein LptC
MTVGFTKGNMNKLLKCWPVFMVLVIHACRNDLSEVSALNTDHDLPVSTTSNVEMLYSDSSLLRAKIKARLRESYITEPQYVEFRKGIQMEFYDSDGRISSKLTAGYAISYNEREVMEARNNVVLTNNKGEKLNTEHLIWDRKANRIYSDVFTKITSPDRIIYGEGFESEGDFSSYKIRKIKGSVRLKE